MTFSHTTLWIVMCAVGFGSYMMRFVFLCMLGDRPLPEWLLRHLHYTGVAVLPSLLAPLVLWPKATGGDTDPARLLAACITLAVGYFTRNILLAILAGAASLYAGLAFLG